MHQEKEIDRPYRGHTNYETWYVHSLISNYVVYYNAMKSINDYDDFLHFFEDKIFCRVKSEIDITRVDFYSLFDNFLEYFNDYES